MTSVKRLALLNIVVFTGCQTWQQFWGPVIQNLSSLTVAEGDTIEITGLQLGGLESASVSVNGKEWQILSATETSISAQVPAAATSGKLAVTARGATSYSESEITVEKYILYGTNNAGNIYGTGVDSITGALGTTQSLTTGGTTNGAIPDTQGKLLYVSTGFGNAVGVYTINQSTGGVAPISGSPFNIGGIGLESGKIGIDRKGRFLYIFDNANNGPISFQLSSSGVPSVRNTVSNSQLGSYLISNPAGTHLYIANSTEVNFMAVDQSTGTLGTASNIGISGSTNEIAFDPSGNSLFGTRTTDIFRANVAANGSLSGITGIAGTFASSSLTMADDGKCLFTADSSTTTIRPYAIDKTTVTAKGTVASVGTAVLVRVTPNGRYLYAYASAGSLTAFRVATDCSLTSISGSFSTGGNINSLVFARLKK